MRGKVPLTNRFQRGILLASAALAVNLLQQFVSPQVPVHLGELLAFVCADGLGLVGAVCALVIDVLPQSLLSGDYMYAARLGCLLLAVGYLSEKRPEIPAVLIGALVWSVFAPLQLWIQPLTSNASLLRVLLAATSELTLLAASSTFLLSRTVRSRLFASLRQLSGTSFLIPAIAAAVTLIAFGQVLLLLATKAVVVTGVLHPLLLLLMLVPFTALLTLCAACYIASGPVREAGLLEQRSLLATGGSSSPLIEHCSLRAGNGSQADEQGQGQAAELASAGICALTRGGAVSFANEQFLELTGIPHSELAGTQIEASPLPRQLKDELVELVNKTLIYGPHTREIRLVESKTPRFLQLSSQFTYDAEKEDPGTVIITVRDMTLAHTVEPRLLQRQKLELLGLVGARVAQEFRSVLKEINARANVSFLSADIRDLRRAMDAIRSAVHKSEKLISVLLDFTAPPRTR